MRRPDFFIIGAPRAGTTSLCSYLAEHPLIYFSPIKEPHFFSTDYPDHPRPSEREYESLFAGANGHHVAVGEGSTSYLSSVVAVPKILEHSPTAKFIVLLRHPVESAYSFHSHLLYHGGEDVEDFERAWRLQAERGAGRCLPPYTPDPRLLQYAKLYQLGAQLERLYQTAGRERVLVHFLDDFRRVPHQGYERTLAFLGVPSDGRQQFRADNQSKQRRSHALASVLGRLYELKVSLGLNRSVGIGQLLDLANTKPMSRKPLTPEFRREMMDSFADDIRKLEKLTSRDLSSWLSINE
jgi:Sulfotransferase family